MRAHLALAALLVLSCPAPSFAQAPATAQARKAEVKRLLDALPSAPDETAGAALEARIRTLWAQGASPAVVLLMQRGRRNLQSEAAPDAIEDFDAAITLQPDYADAWLMRAQALAVAGDIQGAVSDLRQVLVLEPRHFAALAALSVLQEQSGDLDGALRSMQEAVAIHPWLPDAAERLRSLRRKAVGEDA